MEPRCGSSALRAQPVKSRMRSDQLLRSSATTRRVVLSCPCGVMSESALSAARRTSRSSVIQCGYSLKRRAWSSRSNTWSIAKVSSGSCVTSGSRRTPRLRTAVSASSSISHRFFTTMASPRDDKFASASMAVIFTLFTGSLVRHEMDSSTSGSPGGQTRGRASTTTRRTSLSASCIIARMPATTCHTST